MLSAIIGTLMVLSIGILIAHQWTPFDLKLRHARGLAIGINVQYRRLEFSLLMLLFQRA